MTIWGPVLNSVIFKTIYYREPCYKEVEVFPEDGIRRVSTCMGLCYRNPLSDAVHKSYS